MQQARVADHRRRPGQEVDDAVGQPGLAQDLHEVVRRQHRRVRRLPHHGVAHHRRRRRQVGADRREVERRHREDEAFERTRLELVPHAGRRIAAARRRCARRSARSSARSRSTRRRRRSRPGAPSSTGRAWWRRSRSGRYFVANSSAARKKTASRSWIGVAAHERCAASAAATALPTSSAEACATRAITFLCACGERTSALPAPLRRSPPTRSGISTGVLLIDSRVRLSAFFSADPGP